ncbi:MAG: MBL fold metallo-hydrolase [Candidatus Rifleibacteriota bacterium]
MVTFKAGNLICERYILGPMEVNSYLLYNKNSNSGLLIDPGDQSQTLLNRIIELDLNIDIFLTHGHADHIYGVDFFRQHLKAQVIISREDSKMITDETLNLSCYLGNPLALAPAEQIIKHDHEFTLGNYKGRAKSVPGHTPGGMILVFDGLIISGDTLFAGSIGRSDLPGGDGNLLVESIKKEIFALSDRLVLPGHGPETRISEEKNNNPFFGTPFTI